MTVRRRRLGSDGPELSQITYGAMRLDPSRYGGEPSDFLCELHDRGIDTHHSSHEYDSHPAYLQAMANARATGRSFQHIVKLADPSFEDERFDGKRLSSLIDNELSTLGTDTLASVQWLVRTPNVQDETTRVGLLHEQADEIADWTQKQITLGKIQNLSIFPYSMRFARASIASEVTATMTTYLNLAETEAAPLLDEDAGFLALRPLAGGRLWEGGVPDDDLVDASAARSYLEASFATSAERIDNALRFPLLHPATTSIIISVNSPDHVTQAIAAAGTTEPDVERFDATLAALANS